MRAIAHASRPRLLHNRDNVAGGEHYHHNHEATEQDRRAPGARRNPDRVPVLPILVRVVRIAAVVAIAFWVITSIGITTNQNSEDDLIAVSVLNDVKTAQEASFAATEEYQPIDALISTGYLKDPAADAGEPTVENVDLALGDSCFVIAVRSASADVYYNWSEPCSSKKLDPASQPDTSWCAPFPIPANRSAPAQRLISRRDDG